MRLYSDSNCDIPLQIPSNIPPILVHCRSNFTATGHLSNLRGSKNNQLLISVAQDLLEFSLRSLVVNSNLGLHPYYVLRQPSGLMNSTTRRNYVNIASETGSGMTKSDLR